MKEAVVTVLNQIYEEDFLGFSYRFQPGAASTMRWLHRTVPRSSGLAGSAAEARGTKARSPEP
jgi:hypothetical protein